VKLIAANPLALVQGVHGGNPLLLVRINAGVWAKAVAPKRSSPMLSHLFIVLLTTAGASTASQNHLRIAPPITTCFHTNLLAYCPHCLNQIARLI
jgi:hypothetical protein